jgi:hypothetical protein
MRTELIGVRLPLHEAAFVRRQAAERGITKSLHAVNLVIRALDDEAHEQLPAVVARLEQIAEQLTALHQSSNSQHAQAQSNLHNGLHLEQRAFMIEVLTLLRYLFKDDLKIKGDVGRRLQNAVGDIRVKGV